MAYTTINKSGDYFNTKLYTGNGSYGKSVTGVGFQPDFIWIKNRSTTHSHRLSDAVRGTDKALSSDNTSVELSSANLVHSFDSDGFTVDDDGAINGNGNSIASWNWKANGSGSANTDGTISSTVSANTTAGFSIVSYSGTGVNATIGHGLNSSPELVFYKRRNGVDGWKTYAKPIGNDKVLTLDTNSTATSTSYWQNTDPSSTVLTVATGGGFNASGGTYVAYCFHSVKGYSKIGSYEANNNNDGTFVYTGFKPAFILIKSADVSGREWFLIDNKRSASGGSNVNSTNLVASTNSAEWNNDGWGAMDLLSNGFKIRTNDANKNSSGTYIYLAIGQSLVGSNNVPCTAR